jgi:NodT family efflux transporter outer membrane factor (OMF) lipoprotein
MSPGHNRGKIWGGVCAVLPVLTLAGCMVGPNFTQPPAKLQAQFSAPAGAQASTAANALWWQNFNDPILDQLIQTGYQNNLSLQVAGLRVLQARAQLAAAVGELYPQQQAITGGYEYERQSRGSPSNLGGAETYLNVAQLGFSASWEIDFWGKYRRAVQANDAAFLGSIQAYDAALVSLTSDIAQSYITIRMLQAQIAVAQSNISVQTESLRIATVQYNAGQTSQLDVTQAQTQLGITQASLPALQAQLDAQEDALAVLLGTTPDAVPPMIAGGNGIPQAPADVAVGIPKDLLRQRPDVLQAELAAATQSADLGVAKAQLYPALSLTGTFGFESSNSPGASLGDLFQWSSRTVSLGPSLQIPIFNYGQLTNQVRAQDAVFEQSIVNYQNTVLQAQQEVQDGINNLAQAQNTVAALTGATQSAIQSTKLAMIRYVDGQSDYTTVLSAEQAQLQVQNSLAEAQGNVPLSLVALYSALGGGWQIAQNQDVVPASVEQDMRARTNWGGLLAPAAHAAPTSNSAQVKQTYVPTW